MSAIFVIFICSVWPMLINTAFGVAAVRKGMDPTSRARWKLGRCASADRHPALPRRRPSSRDAFRSASHGW